MKERLIKAGVGKYKHNGLCRLCLKNFKQNEKFVVISEYNRFGKQQELRICFDCLCQFLISEFGYKNSVDTLNKLVEEKI